MRTFISLILFSIPILSMGQMEEPQKNSCQITASRAYTFHYNPIVHLTICSGSCIPQTQGALLASTESLSYYRQVHPKHSVRLGIGIVQYRFLEQGIESNGSSVFHPYVRRKNYYYSALMLGHRYMYAPQKVISPFVESTAFYEWAGTGSYFYSLRGVALQLGLGLAWRITPSFSLILDGYYKSGIMNYYKGYRSEQYIPYAYGLELGFLFFMF